MLRPLNLLAGLLFLPVFFFGQTDKSTYQKIDSLVIQFSERKDLTPDSVIGFVNTEFLSDSDKVRAYYKWISYNIEYDVDLMKAMAEGEETDRNSQDADTVFAKRLGVCEGYAKLMKKLCAGSNILCEVVPGYSKSSENETVMDLYHAWNAVKINDAWHLLDVTWSNNYLADDGEYMKEFTGNYFLPEPEKFVKDHLPLDPMWQLLDVPVTKNGFFENTGEHIPGYSYKDSLATYLRVEASEKH
jgi:transglutaminase/protease-like cytokinesis protein 3